MDYQDSNKRLKSISGTPIDMSSSSAASNLPRLNAYIPPTPIGGARGVGSSGYVMPMIPFMFLPSSQDHPFSFMLRRQAFARGRGVCVVVHVPCAVFLSLIHI